VKYKYLILLLREGVQPEILYAKEKVDNAKKRKTEK
jgi:hypothetical protein